MAQADGARVWVVDDDRAVRFVLATALREAGFEVTAFESAADVLSTFDRGAAPPRLLFTDVRMPGDDGLALLDELKRRLPALPVVVMSAHTDVASTAGAFRASGDQRQEYALGKLLGHATAVVRDVQAQGERMCVVADAHAMFGARAQGDRRGAGLDRVAHQVPGGL